MRVVGCFLKHNNKFVLLYRHSHKPDGNTWGLPSGKVEENETDIDAIVRELAEETGYQAAKSDLKLIDEREFTSPSSGTFTYVTYELKLKNPHTIQLEHIAHAEYRWVTIDDADEMDNLIYGLHELFRYVGYVTAPR